MGDLWLPGLGPAYSSYDEVHQHLARLMPTPDDAVILAGCAGNESGYDYHIINDTPATGDYSVGLFQINYYASLYPSRVAAYGTPRQLAASGVAGQCQAAADLFRQAGGFSPWQADITGNKWQKFVGSGPIPRVPGAGEVTQLVNGIDLANAQLAWSAKHIAQAARQYVTAGEMFRSVGQGGWSP